MGEFGKTLLYVGGGAWILIITVMLLPVRRAYRFTMETLIAAPPSRVWAIYDTNLNDPESKAFHEHVLTHERTGGDPPTETALCEYGVLGQRRQIVARYAILLERPPEIVSVRMLEVAGRPFPYGERHLETTELHPEAGGTRLAFSWEGETATLGQRIQVGRQYRKLFGRLKSICEGRPVARMVKKQNPRMALVVSALAIISFGVAFGWIVGVILSLVLVLHEFGHWLAMRLTGQPAPRVMLLPFLGGVTIANHPHKTYFNDAFCALMGAGFSALPALVLLQLMFRWSAETTPIHHGFISMVALTAFAIGAINLLQLLPFLPLDGGQVLRAIMQSFNARWARFALLAIGGAGVAAFLYFQEPLLAGIVGIGVLQSWHMPGKASAARPMGAVGLAAIICAFLTTAAIHGAAVYHGLAMMRQLHD